MDFKGLSLRKKYFAMTGDGRSSVLAEVVKAGSGDPALQVVARCEAGVNSETAAAELMASAKGSVRGEVSIALPLNCFEIVTLTLPVMAEEAVRKALPYHLAKAIDKPLQDCVYDWQITQRLKNQVQITVYLFPARTFQRYQQEFYKRQLVVKYLEADIFAALGLLDRDSRLKPDESVLCVLIWPETLSFGVYENNKVTLVRSVDIRQPTTPLGAEETAETAKGSPGEDILDLDERPVAQPGPAPEVQGPASPLKTGATTTEDADVDILAGFDLLSPAKGKPGEIGADSPAAAGGAGAWEALSAPSQQNAPSSSGLDWPGYLNCINLELMRTKDYYASVLKGGTIKQMVVAGAESFWEQLTELARNSLGVELEQLGPSSTMPGGAPIMNAVCLGTGTRW